MKFNIELKIKVNYIKIGNSKSIIVFLHGWGADLNSFFWLRNFFLDKTVLFVDFSGFGGSPEPDVPYFVSDYVQELKSLIGEFEVSSLTLIGHSFGGRVAIKFASLYQDDYDEFKLCLVDSAGVLPKRGISYHLKVWKYKRLKKKAINSSKYREKIKDMGSSDYRKLSKVMKQTFVNVVNEDLLPFAKFITAETIIVWGKKDKDTKLYMAKKLNKAIKNSKLYIFENAGHFSFLDNKLEFLILLDTFIKN